MVVLAPLPLGAVPAWSWALCAVCTGLMLMAWTVLLWRAGQPPAVPLARIWPSAVLFGLVIAWAMIQTANWTPESWHHPIWKAASEALERPLKGSVSIAPYESWSMITRLVMYAGVFWLSLQLCRDRDRAALALKTIAIAGAVYAAYGIAVLISGTNSVLWFDRPQYHDVVTATFVNRNNYATYAGLGLLAMTAWMVQLIESNFRSGPSRRESVRRALQLLFSRHSTMTVGWITLLLGLILSQSRAGLAATFLALTAACFALAARRRARRKLILGTGFAMLVLGSAIVIVAGGKLIERIGTTQGQLDARGHIYETTKRAIGDNPWLGSGLGSYVDVHGMYSHGEVQTTVLHAHNTYLENALELGVPAAIALNLAIFLLALRLVFGLRERDRDTVYAPLAIAATVLVAAHTMLDFPLQTPAVAMTFFFILGLGVSQSFPTRRA